MTRREIPEFSSVLTDETIGFVISVIDSSGVPERIEDLLHTTTGRPRTLKVRALLVALLLLAIDDRPLHLKAATKLLFLRLSPQWREQLGIKGEADDEKELLGPLSPGALPVPPRHICDRSVDRGEEPGHLTVRARLDAKEALTSRDRHQKKAPRSRDG